MKRKLAKLLVALAVVAILTSVALTFAQTSGLMVSEMNAEPHEECEEWMKQMHRECIEMMNGMHQGDHETGPHSEHEEFRNIHHGCH